MINWANKNLIPVIGNTKALIHVFIVILFFENYFLLVQEKSLLSIDIYFDKLKLAPFICFFFFIAVFKVIWLITCFVRTFIISKYITITDNTTISAHTSFITFTLFILILAYFNIAAPDHLPIKEVDHFILSRLYGGFCILIAGASLFVFMLYPPDKVI
jgi:acetyltransferase-like isoleucine patch superfamily enzyme